MKCSCYAVGGLRLGLAIGTLILSACAGVPTSGVAPAPPKPQSFWRPDTATGPRKIVIDLTHQQARYYKGDTVVGLSPISSGSSAHPTPRGSFTVTEKDVDHRSSCYGAYVDPQTNRIVVEDVDNREDPRPQGTVYKGAKMHYFMRFNGGIGMHEGYLPGYPASHGCIRMPTRMARLFFDETPHGTRVVVTGDGNLAGYQAPVPVGEGATQPLAPDPVAPDRPTPRRGGVRFTEQNPVRGQTIYLY